MIHWLVAGIGDITAKRVIPAILAEPGSRLAAVVTSQLAKASAYGVRTYATSAASSARRDPWNLPRAVSGTIWTALVLVLRQRRGWRPRIQTACGESC